jgi:predicted NUDIX family NTP pyrophosphohydrolase
MAIRQSAGLLLFRPAAGGVEVLLIHPRWPFWARKDEGAWSIPKGGFADGEDPFDAAIREFREETGRNLSPVTSSVSSLCANQAERLVHA